VLNRVGQFYLDCAKAAIDAAAPWLDGFVIWATWPTRRALSCGPTTGARITNPGSRRLPLMPRLGPAGDLPWLRQRAAIFEDYIEAGIDAYNPLEVKPAWTRWTCGAASAIAWVSAAIATFRCGKRETASDPPRGAA